MRLFNTKTRRGSAIEHGATARPLAMANGRETLERFHRQFGLLQHQIDSYNHFMTSVLPEIVYENATVTVTSGSSVHTIRMSNCRVLSPVFIEADGMRRPAVPCEARMRSLTYENPVSVDLEYTVTSDGTLDHSEAHAGQILCSVPTMVGSVSDTCDRKRESPLDRGGYFIINGHEKVSPFPPPPSVRALDATPSPQTILAQAKMRENEPFVFVRKGVHTLEFRARHESRWRSTSTLRVEYRKGQYHVFVPFLRSSATTQHPITIADVYALLGVASRDVGVRELVGGDPTLTDIARACVGAVRTYDEVARDICRACVDGTRIAHIVQFELLPNCGVDNSATTRDLKVDCFSRCVRALVDAVRGKRRVDDRDDFALKVGPMPLSLPYARTSPPSPPPCPPQRLDGPGPLIAIIFRQLFRNFMRTLRTTFIKKITTMSEYPEYRRKKARSVACRASRFLSLADIINWRRFSSNIRSHFATGNWSLSKGTNAGVVQPLDRISFACALPHMRRVNTPLNRETRMVKPRQLDPTSWGIFCCVETPEGIAAGLVSGLAITARVAVGCDSEVVLSRIVGACGSIAPVRGAQTPDDASLLVSGVVKGRFRRTRTREVHAALMDLRRTGHVPIDCSVHVDYAGNIVVHCTAGRMLRPLYVAARMHDAVDGCTFLDMIRRGVVEFVDKMMERRLRIATCAGDVRDDTTHVEIHPLCILGVSAATQPFPERNQAPRNMYQVPSPARSVPVDRYDPRRLVADLHEEAKHLGV